MKVLTIVGARPQFIKAGTVSRVISKYREIQEVIVHTGQHYDSNMSDIFFKEMKIPKPDYFLGVGGNSHGAMTGQMIEKIEEVCLKEKPDFVMVYGDTNSTLAGAIVASKLHIKLAHVEAGLRSFNMKMPEEVNRILTDRVSNILFCPTDVAVENLKHESFDKFCCKIIKSGDVMHDGARFYADLAVKPKNNFKNNFILCTIHRAENTDSPKRMEAIFSALNKIAEKKEVVLPLHPRTKNILNSLQIDTSCPTLMEPVGYLEMVWLIKNCSLVITDSGGLQKEAFFFEKHCLTLRDETEWTELVENKFNVLVGADYKKILQMYQEQVFETNFQRDLYGQGRASYYIVETLLAYGS